MGNTKLISSSRTKQLPNFPVLKSGKHRRCVTKHYTNIALWLYTDEYSLLSFLIYQCTADNCFKYCTILLNKYAKAVELSKKEYDSERFITTNISKLRGCMKGLIEKGLILHTGKNNIFMVNPLLTYECDVINRKQYQLVMQEYQSTSRDKITTFTDFYISLVAEFLQSKKKNYIYGKTK